MGRGENSTDPPCKLKKTDFTYVHYFIIHDQYISEFHGKNSIIEIYQKKIQLTVFWFTDYPSLRKTASKLNFILMNESNIHM